MNGDNDKCIATLTGLKKIIKDGEESMYAGKSDVDAINMEDGAWSFVPGHKDVKTNAEGVKLFSNWMED